MARITSEEASKQIGSKYDTVLIASRRVRELRNGHAPEIANPHPSEIITALREIEQGKVGREYLLKNPNLDRDTKRKSR
jgi:DNA-directed RNA polymerase omega subunit